MESKLVRRKPSQPRDLSQRSAIARLASLLGFAGKGRNDDDDDDDLPRPNATVADRLPTLRLASLAFG